MNADVMQIQWYPGHMTKTRRQMEQDICQVDAVCEIVDARIPLSSRNPDIDAIVGTKPRVIVLNRMDLADPSSTRIWEEWFHNHGIVAFAADCKSRQGITKFTPLVRKACKEKIRRDTQRGMSRPLRTMIVGIPNVGKSTFINQVCGKKSAKVENRPGVTRGKQWVTVDNGLLLLDTPGILWPKFENPTVGMLLAFTGAVKDDVMDIEELACHLMELLNTRYPDSLAQRYKLNTPKDTPGRQLLEAAGKNRGFLSAGGKIHTERMAQILLDEFRSGKIGRFTLEMPEVAVQ